MPEKCPNCGAEWRGDCVDCPACGFRVKEHRLAFKVGILGKAIEGWRAEVKRLQAEVTRLERRVAELNGDATGL